MDSTQDWRSSVEVEDDTFQQSLARLSQQIAARRSMLLVPAPLPPRQREWKAWPLLLLIAVAGAATAGYHYAAFVEGDLLPPKPAVAEAAAPPAPVLAAIAVAATPAIPPAPTAPATEGTTNQEPARAVEPVAATPPPEPVKPAAEVVSPPATMPEPDVALTWAEVLDVQKRLVGFGIDPGPLDGIVGPRTIAGVQRYEELHGAAVTGKADRHLLQMMQLDAAPPAISLEARAH